MRSFVCSSLFIKKLLRSARFVSDDLFASNAQFVGKNEKQQRISAAPPAEIAGFLFDFDDFEESSICWRAHSAYLAWASSQLTKPR